MRETQGELTAELVEVKEKFNEVSSFLEEYKEGELVITFKSTG